MNEFFDNEWKYPVDPRDAPKVDKNKILNDFNFLSKGGKTIKFKELVPALGLSKKDLAIVVFAYKCNSSTYVSSFELSFVYKTYRGN